MTVALIALAIAFRIPAGVLGLIGPAGWLTEKPLQRLADRFAVTSARLKAEAEAQRDT